MKQRDFDDETLLRIEGVLELLPISRSAFWTGIQKGTYPTGFLLSPRTRVWRRRDIVALINARAGTEAVGAQQQQAAE